MQTPKAVVSLRWLHAAYARYCGAMYSAGGSDVRVVPDVLDTHSIAHSIALD